MVVQPHGIPGNKERYTIPDLSENAALTRFFTWQPDRMEFVALKGHHTPFDYLESDVIHRYVYQHDPGADHHVATAGRESFRFNLWPYEASAPARGEPVEVVITDFSYWKSAPAAMPNSPEGESISATSSSLVETLEGWQTGWPSWPTAGQARTFDLLPQTEGPVANGVPRQIVSSTPGVLGPNSHNLLAIRVH